MSGQLFQTGSSVESAGRQLTVSLLEDACSLFVKSYKVPRVSASVSRRDCTHSDRGDRVGLRSATVHSTASIFYNGGLTKQEAPFDAAFVYRRRVFYANRG